MFMMKEFRLKYKVKIPNAHLLLYNLYYVLYIRCDNDYDPLLPLQRNKRNVQMPR